MVAKQLEKTGALLSNENHVWFHQQSPAAQGYMNALFQEYKRQVDECRVVFVDHLDLPFEIHPVEFSIDERGKFNREDVKRETRRLIDEYYDDQK